MLGKPSRKLRKQLEQTGRTAPATVLAIASHGAVINTTNDDRRADDERLLKTTLRVTPEGEPPFEVTQRLRFYRYEVPTVGATVTVIFDPDDHETLMVADRVAARIAARFGTCTVPAAAELREMAHQWGQHAPVDPVTELTRLADLRDRGVLTEAEFNSQKKRVLDDQP